MAENQIIKEAVVKGLFAVEKVLEIMTLLVRATRKGLVHEEDHEMHKDFQQIHEKLETISEMNKVLVQQIHINEINEIYGKYEAAIKHQNEAFNTMGENVKRDPENSVHHMQEFVKIYKEDGSYVNLEAFYNGVMGNMVFGEKKILQVYLEACKGKKKVMEEQCSHLINLISIGVMMLTAYYTITENNVERERGKWDKKFIEIQTEIQKALDQCTEEN